MQKQKHLDVLRVYLRFQRKRWSQQRKPQLNQKRPQKGVQRTRARMQKSHPRRWDLPFHRCLPDRDLRYLLAFLAGKSQQGRGRGTGRGRRNRRKTRAHRYRRFVAISYPKEREGRRRRCGHPNFREGFGSVLGPQGWYPWGLRLWSMFFLIQTHRALGFWSLQPDALLKHADSEIYTPILHRRISMCTAWAQTPLLPRLNGKPR